MTANPRIPRGTAAMGSSQRRPRCEASWKLAKSFGAEIQMAIDLNLPWFRHKMFRLSPETAKELLCIASDPCTSDLRMAIKLFRSPFFGSCPLLKSILKRKDKQQWCLGVQKVSGFSCLSSNWALVTIQNRPFSAPVPGVRPQRVGHWADPVAGWG